MWCFITVRSQWSKLLRLLIRFFGDATPSQLNLLIHCLVLVDICVILMPIEDGRYVYPIDGDYSYLLLVALIVVHTCHYS